MAISTVAFAALIVLITAQQPYLGNFPRLYNVECRNQFKLSAGKLDELQANNSRCGDGYEESKEARCYHRCLKEKLGYYDEEGTLDLDKFKLKWRFLNPRLVDKIFTACSEANKYDDVCDSHYYIQKCFDKVAGNYPHGTKHVSVLNVDAKIEEECKKQIGITDEELCVALSGTVKDLFEENQKAKCYDACIMTKLGYLNGTLTSFMERFDYVDKDDIKEILMMCDKPINENNKCDNLYGMHKCIKENLGEYPVPIEIFN